MVWTATAEGRVEYANRRWFEYTGLARGGTAALGMGSVPPSGRSWPDLESLEPALASGSVFEIEHRLERASDGSYRWHLVRAVPMRRRGAEDYELVWHVHGNRGPKTGRESHPAKAKSSKASAPLAGGVAHDFNNLLMCYSRRSELCDGTPAALTSGPGNAAGRDAGRRTGSRTHPQDAGLCGKGNFCLELVNIGPLARDICETLRPSIPATIRLECHGGRGIPPVEADRTQMRQVLLDLVKNAVEAIGEGVSGRVSVRTEVVEIDGKSVQRVDFGPAAMPAGKYVALEVRDTGCGMDEETQNRIFDPFFTTKFMGRGLGLAAVDGFVRSHRGGVQVDSAPGKGTRIRCSSAATCKEEVARSLAS